MTAPVVHSVRKKRHVAVVGHSAREQFFGAERSLLDILAAVDRQTYEVSCVLPPGNEEYVRAVAAHVTDLHVFPYAWWTRARPIDEEVVSRFEAVFRAGRADLVHANTITLMEPLLAARRLGIPSVVHARELITLNPDLSAELGDTPENIVRGVRDASDFIIANSDATHALYHTPGRSFRLYNGVDVESLDLLNEPEPGRLSVGIVSSNRPDKGIEHFVRLATLASGRGELEFVIIGPRTPYVRALAEAAAAHAPPVKLRLVDYVDDPVDAIRRVNVVVSLSLVPESFGRTIVEAMAARRPVVAYAWGATPELVRHDVDGFLVPPLDFVKALDYLNVLADHPRRVVEMGDNARRRAERLFSLRVFGACLNEIYRQIMELWPSRE